MLENPKKFAADQDPSENDEVLEGEQTPTRPIRANASEDMMGPAPNRSDKAERWLAENDPGRNRPDKQAE